MKSSPMKLLKKTFKNTDLVALKDSLVPTKIRFQNTSLSPQFSNTVFNTVFYRAELKGNEKTVRKVCF